MLKCRSGVQKHVIAHEEIVACDGPPAHSNRQVVEASISFLSPVPLNPAN